MDVSQILKQAWAAVQDADLPQEIQHIAFREATRLVASTELGSSQPTSLVTGGHDGSKAATIGTAPAGAGSDLRAAEGVMIGKLSSHTNIDVDKLSQLVHLEGDELRVSLPAVKLGKNNAEKTRAIAQILAIARDCGLDEPETPFELIRAEVSRLKCYDNANFSSQLSALTNVGYILSGSGRSRKLRPKPAGISAFGVLVTKLLGE